MLKIRQFLQRYQQKRKQSAFMELIFKCVLGEGTGVTSRSMLCQIIINIIKRYKTQLLPKALTVTVST